MFSDFCEYAVERFRARGLDLNPRVTAVSAAVADLNLENLELRAKVDDQVEDLGE